MDFSTKAANEKKRPSERWRKDSKEIVERRQKTGYPADIFDAVVQPVWDGHVRDCGTAEEAGDDLQINALVANLDSRIVAAFARAREHGILRPASRGIEERLDVLEGHGWFAREVDNLRAMITPADPLVRVDYFHVELKSGSRISRDQCRAYGQPEGWSNTESWLAAFTSDATVTRIKQAAEERAAVLAAPWRGNINSDFPNGVRPGQ